MMLGDWDDLVARRCAMKVTYRLTEADIKKALAAWTGGTKRASAYDSDVSLEIVNDGRGKLRVEATVEVTEP